MFLFPSVYILSFIYALYLLLRNQIKGFLVFIIAGLPLYINALSVSYMYGFSKFIPLMQSFKEIALLVAFIVVILNLKKKPKLHFVDKLMIAFFIYSFLYVLIPIGTYSFTEKVIGFKALAVFPLIYFTGRLCSSETINIKQIFSFVCILSIAAAIVLFFEVFFYTHLHTLSGFMEFSAQYFNAEPSGNYGLIWTFETETGLKRFGSIFSSPLELASSSIVALSVLMALATTKKYKIDFSNLYVISFIATSFCVVFAVSRASFLNYFILIYCFAHITKNKKLVFYFHCFILASVIFIAFFLQGDLFDFIINTLSFKNPSSLGHILEWLNGINAMVQHPLGMGLGSSGRVSMESNDQVGGENQLIIIGVQVGIVALIIYVLIYASLIKSGLQALKNATGKKKRLIMFVILVKIGLIIPLITSYIDTFNYITYLSYFLSGLMINMIMSEKSSGATNKITPLQPPAIPAM